MHLPTSTLRQLTAALAALLLFVGLAGCGDDDKASTGSGDETTTTAGTGPGGYGAADDGGDDGGTADLGDYVVVAKDIAYQNDLTVEADDTFVFDNQDSTKHTLTSDDDAFTEAEVDGASHSDPVTPPTEPGEYKFHCEIHSSMHGTLTVQ